MLDTTELDPQSIIDIQLREQALALQKKRLHWHQSKAIVLPVIQELVKQGIEPGITQNYIDVSFAGDAPKLKAAIRAMMQGGFRTTADPPKPGDTQWYGFFRREDSQIEIFVNFTSSVCVRKKVGTRTVQEDVYEVICGDCGVESMQLPAPAPVLEESVF